MRGHGLPAPQTRIFRCRIRVRALWQTRVTVIGAGTVISPIIKVVTTVAVLAATYFFIVRPILDTTEDTVSSVSNGIRNSGQQGSTGSTAADLEASRSRAVSFGRSVLAGSQPWPDATREILGCVREAGDSLPAMRRCERLGETITGGVLSDRNFADSYADSVAAQGNSAGAQRIHECVQKAGFESKPMENCRQLADKLLFG